jgi:L-fucose mutarotase
MEVVDRPDEIPQVQVEIQREIDRAEGRHLPMGSIERFAFYERARQCYGVIATGERRFYGNVVLQKGVVPSG